MSTRSFTFDAASTGEWTVRSQTTVCGPALDQPTAIRVLSGFEVPSGSLWTLRGITSNVRYVEQGEKTALLAKQEGLGRPAATFAALIPIQKSAAWWDLTQDERRQIFEAPAVVYPASEVESWKSRADMESASPMRQSIQAAA